MEKHCKDFKNIIVEKDSLHVTLKETYANYRNLKVEKDILNVGRNKLQRYYIEYGVNSIEVTRVGGAQNGS